MFERFGVQVIAYCLMSNRYHLVLYCPDGGLLGACTETRWISPE